jgi:flagellar biosynthesis protein FliP
MEKLFLRYSKVIVRAFIIIALWIAIAAIGGTQLAPASMVLVGLGLILTAVMGRSFS